MLGMATQNIEVKNIVVGDLPYDSSRGDFYVSISVATNPDMVTALQEEKMPKTVHFPEILTLKLRDSPLEPRVVFTVKELNIAGSETLCDCVLSAGSIIDWAKDSEPLKRFQMRPLNSDIERETPPWIAMEFGYPTENRQLEALPSVWSFLRVRTWLPPMDQQSRMAAEQMRVANSQNGRNAAIKGGIMTSDGSILGTRTLQEDNIQSFKYKYVLLDDSGNPIEEPDEIDLDRIHRMRSCVGYVLCCCDMIVFLLIAGYAAFRFYVWSCYRQFRWITMYQMLYNNISAVTPVATHALRKTKEMCHDSVRGTGIAEGAPCRPSANQTLFICENISETNRPEAFVALAQEYLGWDTFKGFSCFHGICALRDRLPTTMVAVTTCIALILLTRCCKCWADMQVKDYKRRCQKASAFRLQEFRSTMMRSQPTTQVPGASHYGAGAYTPANSAMQVGGAADYSGGLAGHAAAGILGGVPSSPGGKGSGRGRH
jgi:hypothetical protein